MSPALRHVSVMNATFVDVSAHPELAYLAISGTTAEPEICHILRV